MQGFAAQAATPRITRRLGTVRRSISVLSSGRHRSTSAGAVRAAVSPPHGRIVRFRERARGKPHPPPHPLERMAHGRSGVWAGPCVRARPASSAGAGALDSLCPLRLVLGARGSHVRRVRAASARLSGAMARAPEGRNGQHARTRTDRVSAGQGVRPGKRTWCPGKVAALVPRAARNSCDRSPCLRTANTHAHAQASASGLARACWAMALRGWGGCIVIKRLTLPGPRSVGPRLSQSREQPTA